MMIGVYEREMSKKSFTNAVSPPTRHPRVLAERLGTYVSRRRVIAATAASLCARSPRP